MQHGGHHGRWPQQPPPYQQTDSLLESGRVPPTSPHTHSANEPLLGRCRPIHHTSFPVQKELRPAKNCKFFYIVVFLFGASIGYWLDRKQYEVERIRMDEETSKWKEEKAVMDAERKKWEEGQRGQLVWDDVHPGRCLGYATREYIATLSNIGIGLDGLSECANKTLSFHGREILPTSCSIEGPCRRVTGHWAIDFDEAGCSPWWDRLTDKGCDGDMHSRRYEAHLMHIPNGGDWEALCKTTPTAINGISYNGAMSCVNSIWGVFGIWFVEDMNCF